MTKLFGTDGIRGKANRFPMDADTAMTVGRAVARLFFQPGRGRILIGKDSRLSSDMLESALAAGIASMGADALLAGMLPTPAIAFAARAAGADAGIVVSASHNPYWDNGIKIFSGQGFKLTDAQEADIEALVQKQDLSEFLAPSEKIGRIYSLESAGQEYLDFLSTVWPDNLSMRRMKIAMDTSNGAASVLAPEIFARFGAQVEVIHNQPDGFNINDQCGSQHTAGLQELTVKCGADLGLAFDGDADRLIAVDETGKRLSGDQILLICAIMLKNLGKLQNDCLVTTVMSNLGLRLACRKHGLRHHASEVGDRHVLEDMQRLGAVIGGEESGHIIFLDHHSTGDGILAGMQLIAAMLRSGRPLSALSRLMDVYPQKLVNVPVSRKPDIFSVPRIAAVIRDIETGLGENGRVLVRYSGTENLCRVMVEAQSAELAETGCNRIAEVVRSILN
ncbi:MAG: phosphoglucosamine mutase [Desulfobacterales bacterium]|nr:phosphoglucosamine mutase [Desulfobacterales bacterium]MDD3081623.1 phosphoglucosamine mutase [Desulfobacterales bacterium]MDD4463671.1 phosphoglucosamine mutase [Desulfobacterales bacterium]MDY0378142.1 phosphoglucosamine mutase [Desulfobacterales bacterium]